VASGGCLGYIGRCANLFAKAARDPKRTYFATRGLLVRLAHPLLAVQLPPFVLLDRLINLAFDRFKIE
jgi:hypothetical protein